MPQLLLPVLELALTGFLLVWIYSAIRPRFRAGPSTALRAAVAVWVCAPFLMTIHMIYDGFGFPASLLLLLAVSVLPAFLLAGLMGGWLYREKPGAARLTSRCGSPEDLAVRRCRMRILIASLLLLLWVNSLAAQQPDPVGAPGESHKALVRLAGKWEAQARFWQAADPAAPPMECTATVDASMVMGGRFLFQKVVGQCMGQLLDAIGVIGHDNATRQYQAASFSNMETSISRHAGERNDAGDIVLNSSYRDQTSGATVNRRTVRRLISENEWVETAHETRNGAERMVMEIRARRAN